MNGQMFWKSVKEQFFDLDAYEQICQAERGHYKSAKKLSNFF